MMETVKSEFVVELNAYTTSSNSNFYLAMEYCNGGDLFNFKHLRGGGFLPEKEAKILIK